MLKENQLNAVLVSTFWDQTQGMFVPIHVNGTDVALHRLFLENRIELPSYPQDVGSTFIIKLQDNVDKCMKVSTVLKEDNIRISEISRVKKPSALIIEITGMKKLMVYPHSIYALGGGKECGDALDCVYDCKDVRVFKTVGVNVPDYFIASKWYWSPEMTLIKENEEE